MGIEGDGSEGVDTPADALAVAGTVAGVSAGGEVERDEAVGDAGGGCLGADVDAAAQGVTAVGAVGARWFRWPQVEGDDGIGDGYGAAFTVDTAAGGGGA